MSLDSRGRQDRQRSLNNSTEGSPQIEMKGGRELDVKRSGRREALQENGGVSPTGRRKNISGANRLFLIVWGGKKGTLES